MDLGPKVRASKLIALALRHDPAALGIALDRGGFTSVSSLLAGLSAHGVTMTEPELVELVCSSDKQRFAFSAVARGRAPAASSQAHGFLPERSKQGPA